MPSVSFSRSHAWPSCVVWASSAVVLAAAFVVTGMPAAADAPDATMHLGFETTDELLADFASQAERYEAAGLAGLEERRLAVKPGRFGNCLHIEDGSPSSKGTWNESGLDCDLIVAVMWGEWHKKPHYWGAGAFHGRRGTVAFWVKDETLHPGIVFMQGSIAWGRKERDLFTVEVDKEGRLSAHIRDLQYRYHRVDSGEPVWQTGEWQHIAVAYDRAYGLKLYHNGRLVGSTWSEDAWWGTTQPGLFSPFLPESFYDEVYFFDYPLTEDQIAALHEENRAPSSDAVVSGDLEPAACRRLLATYGDLANMSLPTATPGASLHMKQSELEACSDEQIPAWWILDGRYELAWPHPYRLFTFILGDADFHGTKADLLLRESEQPNYVAFEGILDGLKLVGFRSGDLATGRELAELDEYSPFFYSQDLALDGAQVLRLPFLKDYGVPPGLEGNVHFPLTGDTRVHEIQLWQVIDGPPPESPAPETLVSYLSEAADGDTLPRYGPALRRLMPSYDRRVIAGAPSPPAAPATVTLGPLQSVHLVGAGTEEDVALDAIRLQLLLQPRQTPGFLWVRLRDPGNPSRIWAQTCLRVDFAEAGTPQAVDITLDIIDLMLAAEDRILVELISANGCDVLCGDAETPSALTACLSADRERSLGAYVANEIHPGCMQYCKEYNYRPWLFTGEEVNIASWNVFGGPYDMAYPMLAVLRHDPDNVIANTYRTLQFDRSWFGSIGDDEARRTPSLNVPENAPQWAIWGRELYTLSERVTHWIASQQRSDGMFWGGANDDSFIPLGWAAMPLMGDEICRNAWLRFYDGVEAMGIFYDGYCDIWPIDPLHITDFITSRGLMLSFGLGDPHVFERELRTAERYLERVSATNAKRAAAGLPPLSGKREARDEENASVIENMEAEILDYSRTHLECYWGKTPAPEPHILEDRAELAGKMQDIVEKTDEKAVFGFTEARVHTDNQRGIGRDLLVAAALGGRVQGRAEPHPISIAVSWEGATADLARLVTYADTERLSVDLYNFAAQPIDCTMRVWRLENGLYELSMGPDEDGDGTVDAGTPQTQQLPLGRFATVPLAIPPQQNIVLDVTQIEAGERQGPLADLAVGGRDVRPMVNGTLEVTIHNIGAAPATDVRVDLVNARGEVLETQSVAGIASPAEDFSAQRAKVVFAAAPGDSAAAVVIDPEDAVEEILEENNELRLEEP